MEISLRGDVQVAITAPSSAAARAADLLGYIYLFPGGVDLAQSDRSFELVGGSPVSSVSRQPETRDSILRSFGDCPARFCVHASKLCGSSASGRLVLSVLGWLVSGQLQSVIVALEVPIALRPWTCARVVTLSSGHLDLSVPLSSGPLPAMRIALDPSKGAPPSARLSQ